MKLLENAHQCLAHIKPHSHILVQGGMATPMTLINSLKERANDLTGMTMMHIHTHGDAWYTEDEFQNNWSTKNFFVGSNIRKNLNYKNVDFVPCFLSEIPMFFAKGEMKCDVLFLNVSPADKHGHYSLGTSVDIIRPALEVADLVIAQINQRVPRTYGDAIINDKDIDFAFLCDEELHLSPYKKPSAEEELIGQHIAGIIEDGSTLQMGIGAIPDAVLSALKGHQNLGVHTEMFSDGIIPLLESGVVNNSQKRFHQGRTVTSFIVGSRKLVDFVDDNPSIHLYSSDYINSPRTIARNPKVVAINSAIQIDLTGQVCADSIGHQIYSGVGGQMDFIRGASLSEGGKPIIAIPSRTKKGVSKITPELNGGAGVVTTRAHIHYVATEYGVVNLYGKSLGERAKLLTSIAHPDDREGLERSWYEIIK